MKTSLKWLANYVDIPWDASELAERLTMAGLEVEGVAVTGAVPDGVVVGEIIERTAHPNADKLSVCRVSLGSGAPLQIVCGAPNCDPGVKAPVAPAGTVLGGDFRIRKAKLRGVESNGMLCAPDELGLGDDHSGIMELPAEAVPGRPLSEYVRQDTVIDWEVTPNRPDWLSHLGIAREIAALSGGQEHLRLPRFVLRDASGPSVETLAAVQVDAPDLCPRYTVRVIRGVSIGPSPAWLRSALESVGIRPINNVVDITNFVMMECGQPLHAFDYDRIARHTITVRRAAEGEQLVTLDGQTHELTVENLLIADASGGIALAGVMGGRNSEISGDTVTVLLESAAFHAGNIRATAKKLGLHTESSHRFERGVSLDGVEFASARAAALMCELAGGEVVEGHIDAYPAPYKPPSVTCRVQRAAALLGVALTSNDVAGSLERLGLGIVGQTEQAVTAAIPSFRLDLEREADLIEEVVRMFGLSNLPAVPAPAQVGGSIRNDAYVGLQEVRDEMLGLGLSEAINYSLLSREGATAGTGFAATQLVGLANPISMENAWIRPSLLPGLIQTAAHNVAHNTNDLAMFEIGRVVASAPPLPEERMQLGILLSGKRHPERFGRELEMLYDFADLKGLLAGWLESRRIVDVGCLPARHPGFRDGAAATLEKDGTTLAVFGEVAPGLTDGIRLHNPLYMALVELDTVFETVTPPRILQPLPQFPATARDISLVAPRHVSNGDVIAVIRDAGCEWLEDVRLFDVYEDDASLGRENRSLAYSLTYRDCRRTLTDDDANRAHEAVKAFVAKKLPVEFR